MLSYSLVVFGVEHKQSQIVDEGYIVHGDALKSVNNALSTPDCFNRDDVLLAVVALAMLEAVIPSSPGSYLYHMIGLDKLLELRDPSLHISPWSLNIYQSVRHLLIFSSLRSGRPCVFALPQWKAVLRIGCSEAQLHEQELWDVLADCSVLQATLGKLLSLDVSEIDVCQLHGLYEQALFLKYMLDTWRGQYGEKDAGVDACKPSLRESRADYMPNRTSVPRHAKLSNSSAAARSMLHNTALICVLGFLRKISNAGSSLGWQTEAAMAHRQQLDETSVDELMASESIAAAEICKCIPRLLPRSSDFPIIHWAVSTAWSTLKGRNTQEGAWLKDLLESDRGRVLAKALMEL
jgi:hypothetical protein